MIAAQKLIILLYDHSTAKKIGFIVKCCVLWWVNETKWRVYTFDSTSWSSVIQIILLLEKCFAMRCDAMTNTNYTQNKRTCVSNTLSLALTQTVTRNVFIRELESKTSRIEQSQPKMMHLYYTHSVISIQIDSHNQLYIFLFVFSSLHTTTVERVALNWQYTELLICVSLHD